MDALHTSTLRQLGRIPYETAARLIEQKLSSAGIHITRAQRAQIAEWLEADGDHSKLPFDLGPSAPDKHVPLVITAENTQRVMRAVQKVMDDLPAMLDSVMTQTATGILKTLRRRWAAEAGRQRADMEPFTQRLAQRWKRPVARLSMLLTIARELGESVNNEVRTPEFADRRHTVNVLTRLHARACQIALEIITLLRGGFADGAIARWRTLHEIAVTAFFVAQYGESVAERYIAYRVVESFRASVEYEKHRDRLGYEPLAPDKLRHTASAFAAAEARFGKNFTKPYGWAAEALKMKDPKFVHIEEAVRIDHLRPFYKLATQNVHANPNAAFFRLGLIGESPTLLAGASNLGLSDPGQITARSLTQVTTTIGNLNPTVDNVVALKVLTLLLPEVRDSFARVAASQARLASRQASI